MLERRRLPAWRRDGQRYYTLLGFKAVGVVFAALLGMALWFDGVSTRISTLSDSRSKLTTEVRKMKALVALRKKIEATLITTREQQASGIARGINAPGRAEAGAILQSELQAGLSMLKITGAEISIGDKPKSQPNGATVLVNASFLAVPEQIVNVLQNLASSNRLYRVNDFELNVDPDPAATKLKVSLQVEAMYFVPDAKQKDKRGVSPSKPTGAMAGK